MFRALRIRNYRLFFVGQTISQVGTWCHAVALAWLVLDLSHNSGLAAGLVTGLLAAPTLLFGVWAGAVIDRVSKVRLLLWSQVAQAVCSAVLAGLVLSHAVELWAVYAVALASGVAVLFDNPTRQSLLPELVSLDELAHAVGLNGAIAQLARIVGPAMAGVLIAAFGTGVCFVVDAASFTAVIVALLLVRTDELHIAPRVARARRQGRDGLRYAWETPQLRRGLLTMAILGIFLLNWGVVFPLLARATFDVSPEAFGIMTTALASGSLIGGLVLARQGYRRRASSSRPASPWARSSSPPHSRRSSGCSCCYSCRAGS
jgi:MFS family permease